MKSVALLSGLLSLLVVLPVCGQEAYQSNMEKKLHEYQRMKRSGIIELSFGGASAIAGTALLIPGLNKLNAHHAPEGSEEAYNQETTGGLMVLGSIICYAAFLPLAIHGSIYTAVGSRKSKEYQKLINGMSVGIITTPKTKGITLVYRF